MQPRFNCRFLVSSCSFGIFQDVSGMFHFPHHVLLLIHGSVNLAFQFRSVISRIKIGNVSLRIKIMKATEQGHRPTKRGRFDHMITKWFFSPIPHYRQANRSPV